MELCASTHEDRGLGHSQLVGTGWPVADDPAARCGLTCLPRDVGKNPWVGVTEEAGALPVRCSNEGAVEWAPLVLDLLRTAESVHVQHRPVGVPDDADGEGAQYVV